ncbi:hypothetical protein GLAREA_05846 [Glarea lozoyensis ATCC 20868]|uniref:CBM-cenC domain-containing protein n=1 Tax=Glarea lozoyensis (strain ATCC 20868 / MF5171) TaxID=1116229 RepID=S3D6U6_GLAL2|nr:uncharacterized protein GLAREA_05846 [Glarea lozoyensis ATCC 20868]EPE32834.1 hypothetical protein GLAREA_05846 [Glarea lozoyensis ATCC 20868]
MYIKLIAVVGIFIGGSKAATVCSADNCYRALFPCPTPTAVSQAAAFCATITSGGVTATNFPARATAACGTSAARYISACKCGPTCTTTAACSTPTAGLIYGDFECGIPPWTTQIPDAAASVKVSSPGFTNQKAFEVDFTPPSVVTEFGVSARIIGPAAPVSPGKTYKLTFATWFEFGSSGFTGVMINDIPYRTIDPNDYGMGHWHFNQLAWTANATETTATPKFEFLFSPSQSVAKVDDVVFAALSATCNANPPVGILPDGEFECGLGSWTTQNPDSAATVSISTGSAYIGSKAFQVAFKPPPQNAPLGVSARLISKKLTVVPGTAYYLQFYTFFDNVNAGFIGVMINDQAVYTIDAADKGAGYYNVNDVIWTPATGVKTATIKFEFLFGNGPASVDRIDSIIFQPFNP